MHYLLAFSKKGNRKKSQKIAKKWQKMAKINTRKLREIAGNCGKLRLKKNCKKCTICLTKNALFV